MLFTTKMLIALLDTYNICIVRISIFYGYVSCLFVGLSIKNALYSNSALPQCLQITKKMSHEFSTLFGTLVFEIYYSVNFGTIFGPYLVFNSFYCANFGIFLNHSIISLEQRHFLHFFGPLRCQF